MGTVRESERDKIVRGIDIEIVRRIGTEIRIIALGHGERGSIDDKFRDRDMVLGLWEGCRDGDSKRE